MAIGLLLAYFFEPGKGIILTEISANSTKDWEWTSFFINIIPENIIDGFVSDNLLALMFIAIVLGLGIASMRISKSKKTNPRRCPLPFPGPKKPVYLLRSWTLQYRWEQFSIAMGAQVGCGFPLPLQQISITWN